MTLANDGLEALSAWQAQPFDLILMDLQMPNMDGFEATAVIRAKERVAGTHIPIVAMTAHAITGTRERCLSAGMDGYVSKPVNIQELLGTLAHIGEPATSQDERTHVVTGDPDLSLDDFAGEPAIPPLVDVDTLMGRVQGDRALLTRMVSLLLSDTPPRLEQMRAALECRNTQNLAKLAHKIKGAISNFSAESTTSIAQRLETAAQEGNLEIAREVFLDLEKAIERLRPELETLVEIS